MNIINKKHIYTTFLLLPYFFAVTGMLVLDSGDKKMIPLFLIGIIASILAFKKETILSNLRSPFIWLVSISCIYTIFSYYYHGASSRELRALIGSTLFLIFFPYNLLNHRVLGWVVLLGSITAFLNSVYFNVYMGISRDAGYINPIPYATSCALIAIISFSLLIEQPSFKEKLIASLAFLLSLPPIILSETRGIWLALTVSTLVLVIFKYIKTPPSRNQLTFIFITVTVSLFSGTYLFKDKIIERYDQTVYEVEKIQSGNYNTSIGQRLQLWQLAPQLIQKKPLLGYGNEKPKLLQDKLKNKKISNLTFRLASHHYHNQFLNKMVKSGVIGLIFIIGLLLYPLIIVKKLPSIDAYIAIGLVSLLFIAGLTDVPFNHPQPLILYLLFLVPICSRCKRVTND
ncbi:O-antigen ligase family protein [Vibrio splendidus]|uniref:O-antigen ligase family protein n=1 Tax=Vibrio splendidus TaxID=29497 RepID=UPI000D355AA7|nr:O-antigen ligase family protein [Vibrio splendidus]PTP85287.1 O-antigen ligase [Vibrio splendidus]